MCAHAQVHVYMSRPVSYVNLNVHLYRYVRVYNAFVWTILLCTVLWGYVDVELRYIN